MHNNMYNTPNQLKFKSKDIDTKLNKKEYAD